MILPSNQSSAATTNPIPVAGKRWSQCVVSAAAIASVSYALGVLPWYLSQFPARLTLDSADQLLQALGRRPLDNSHPVAVTLLLRTVNSDPGLYVFLQYLFVSLAFGAVFGLASHGFSTRP